MSTPLSHCMATRETSPDVESGSLFIVEAGGIWSTIVREETPEERAARMGRKSARAAKHFEIWARKEGFGVKESKEALSDADGTSSGPYTLDYVTLQLASKHDSKDAQEKARNLTRLNALFFGLKESKLGGNWYVMYFTDDPRATVTSLEDAPETEPLTAVPVTPRRSTVPGKVVVATLPKVPDYTSIYGRTTPVHETPSWHKGADTITNQLLNYSPMYDEDESSAGFFDFLKGRKARLSSLKKRLEKAKEAGKDTEKLEARIEKLEAKIEDKSKGFDVGIAAIGSLLDQSGGGINSHINNWPMVQIHMKKANPHIVAIDTDTMNDKLTIEFDSDDTADNTWWVQDFLATCAFAGPPDTYRIRAGQRSVEVTDLANFLIRPEQSGDLDGRLNRDAFGSAMDEALAAKKGAQAKLQMAKQVQRASKAEIAERQKAKKIGEQAERVEKKSEHILKQTERASARAEKHLSAGFEVIGSIDDRLERRQDRILERQDKRVENAERREALAMNKAERAMIRHGSSMAEEAEVQGFEVIGSIDMAGIIRPDPGVVLSEVFLSDPKAFTLGRIYTVAHDKGQVKLSAKPGERLNRAWIDEKLEIWRAYEMGRYTTNVLVDPNYPERVVIMVQALQVGAIDESGFAAEALMLKGMKDAREGTGAYAQNYDDGDYPEVEEEEYEEEAPRTRVVTKYVPGLPPIPPPPRRRVKKIIRRPPPPPPRFVRPLPPPPTRVIRHRIAGMDDEAGAVPSDAPGNQFSTFISLAQNNQFGQRLDSRTLLNDNLLQLNFASPLSRVNLAMISTSLANTSRAYGRQWIYSTSLSDPRKVVIQAIYNGGRNVESSGTDESGSAPGEPTTIPVLAARDLVATYRDDPNITARQEGRKAIVDMELVDGPLTEPVDRAMDIAQRWTRQSGKRVALRATNLSGLVVCITFAMADDLEESGALKLDVKGALKGSGLKGTLPTTGTAAISQIRAKMEQIKAWAIKAGANPTHTMIGEKAMTGPSGITYHQITLGIKGGQISTSGLQGMARRHNLRGSVEANGDRRYLTVVLPGTDNLNEENQPEYMTVGCIDESGRINPIGFDPRMDPEGEDAQAAARIRACNAAQALGKAYEGIGFAVQVRACQVRVAAEGFGPLDNLEINQEASQVTEDIEGRFGVTVESRGGEDNTFPIYIEVQIPTVDREGREWPVQGFDESGRARSRATRRKARRSGSRQATSLSAFSPSTSTLSSSPSSTAAKVSSFMSSHTLSSSASPSSFSMPSLSSPGSSRAATRDARAASIRQKIASRQQQQATKQARLQQMQMAQFQSQQPQSSQDSGSDSGSQDSGSQDSGQEPQDYGYEEEYYDSPVYEESYEEVPEEEVYEEEYYDE